MTWKGELHSHLINTQFFHCIENSHAAQVIVDRVDVLVKKMTVNSGHWDTTPKTITKVK